MTEDLAILLTSVSFSEFFMACNDSESDATIVKPRELLSGEEFPFCSKLKMLKMNPHQISLIFNLK